jgi:hypothetical protein
MDKKVCIEAKMDKVVASIKQKGNHLVAETQ